jgi:hypothetical protein
MNARLSPTSARHRRPWTLAVCGLLLAAGALIQACSDNSGPVGPTFPAKVVGDAIGGPAGTINIQVTVSPGIVERGRRTGVTFFLTSAGGAPLQGRTISFSSTSGKFDALSGVTDVNGTFSTTLLISCDVPEGAGSITAVVEGKSAVLEGAFTVITASSNNPCPAPAPVAPVAGGGGGGGVVLPVVTITSAGTANDSNPVVTATFTLSRTGSTAAALSVSLATSGSAVFGTDYGLTGSIVGTTVTIPAGSTSTVITLNPVFGDGAEPDDPSGPNPDAELAILTVSPTATYTVGTPGSAQVEIIDGS